MATAKLLPEELLVGLIKLGDLNIFKIDAPKLHKVFFKLKQDSGFGDLLKVFRFSGSPAAPYSEVLDNAFFNLQYSNKLKRDNLDLVVYKSTPSADAYYNSKVKPKVDAELETSLKNLASQFKAEGVEL